MGNIPMLNILLIPFKLIFYFFVSIKNILGEPGASDRAAQKILDA